MRYFTEEATYWDAPPELFKAACEAYKARAAELRSQLMPQMRDLADIDLHDGIVRQVVVDRRGASVTLRLRCGCTQDWHGNPVGYFDLDIHYQGVALDPMDVEALEQAALRRVEVLYTELDREPGGLFIHRFLCTGDFGGRGGEMAVRFTALDLVRRPREKRSGGRGWPRRRYLEVHRPTG